MDNALQAEGSGRLRRRRALAWLLALAVLLLYGALPDPELVPSPPQDDDREETDRLEILDVSPREPYPGSSIVVTHNGKVEQERVHVYAGKTELSILARHPTELVALLPSNLPAGDLKLRLSSDQVTKPYHVRTLRTKPFHVRVKTPNWRKVFRSLIGGVALLAFGMSLMARGVRA
ncbi:MAG: hypothetical protein JWN04_2219, partial [Myxococcaceae bacterium]|nr:hypothetical protein [Myxococcaceae bacterium]